MQNHSTSLMIQHAYLTSSMLVMLSSLAHGVVSSGRGYRSMLPSRLSLTEEQLSESIRLCKLLESAVLALLMLRSHHLPSPNTEQHTKMLLGQLEHTVPNGQISQWVR